MYYDDTVRSVGSYDMTNYACTMSLQLFLFERFPSYGPKPEVLPSYRPKFFRETKVVRKVKNEFPRVVRWKGKGSLKKLMMFLDEESEFVFRPYVKPMSGKIGLGLYDDPLVDANFSDSNLALHSLLWALIPFPCCLPFSTEALNDSVTYNPQRVGRQFGLDQGPPTEGVSRVTFNDCFSYFKIESFTAICRSRGSFIIPPLSRKGRYTEGGLSFWKENLESFWIFSRSDQQRVTPSRILRNDGSLRLPSPKKGEDHNRGRCGRNMFLSEKKSVAEGHNAKIEDEIFETSISSPSDNFDKVDEALRVVTKEDEISLLAEFSTPAVRHGKGKELKRIEKSSELAYCESSIHNLSRRSSDYDSKDDVANSKQENFSPEKNRDEGDSSSSSSKKTGSSASNTSRTLLKKEQRSKKGNDPSSSRFEENSISTLVSFQRGSSSQEKKLSIDANNTGIDIEGVGIDVVDIEKVGIDIEKVGGDDVGVDVEEVGSDNVGVEKVRVEKIGGDNVGVEMDGVDFEKVGGKYVGGEKVGGEKVGVEFEKVGGECVGGDYVGGEKTDKVGDLFLRTRVYNRRPLTVAEGMLGSQAGVGGEGLKASEFIPNVDINVLQNTVESVEIGEIVQNDGTVKPLEAILSSSAADLARVAVTRETLPSCGDRSIPNVPTSSHRPISRRYNRVLWFGDMVGEKYVPFLNLVRDRYPQTFENFKCKLPELRYVMLDMLGRTIKQLDERAIVSFQISEMHELLCAIADFKLNGLQVEWLERHLTSLLPCGFYSTFLQQKMKIRQEIVRTRARFSNLEAKEQRLLGLCQEKEKEFSQGLSITSKATKGLF
ncbi:hypothetical protein F0562_029349 [Nyssa sinensis]|uniref:Aminotransferase-like plant mobile domain-containing protein n=1 Tax=Nyssa sinensis TaxID=561372 RepID=A0A5J5B6S8_9ASTE|nr:hypothetical protein F0562_029349 [Nyssa sinensis]